MPTTNGTQTFMNTIDGMSPALDAYGRIATISYTPKIVAKTASYTVTAAESGTIFTTTGATAAVTFTLPAISTGPWEFKFIAGADVNMVVAAATAGTMITMNDAAANSIAFQTSSEKIGGTVEVYCDGTSLFGLARLATEAQTPTIAT